MFTVPVPVTLGVFPPYKENEDACDYKAILSFARMPSWFDVDWPVRANKVPISYPFAFMVMALSPEHSNFVLIVLFCIFVSI